MSEKKIWEAKDIVAGKWIIRESSPKWSENTGFARTVVFKIGFLMDPERNKYCKISGLTDGWVYPAANTKEEFAQKLNEDRFGYRPLTKEEFIRLVISSDQGFTEEF